MEKRINKSIETYLVKFKDNIKKKINELEFDDNQKVNELLEYVYDYERLTLFKDDFVKRKRIQNSIPMNNRCNARRANEEQCTRRRKNGSEFCGTHSKGTPNGSLNEDTCGECANKKLEVVATDINGIIYYIDEYSNIYKTEDIMNEKENPQIIGKFDKIGGPKLL